MVFLLGKIVNRLFCRKRYIANMIDSLFQVQDVSKISNIKKVNYTSKKINEPTNPYKNKKGTATSSPITPRISIAAFGGSAQVKPMMDHNSQRTAEDPMHDFVSDIGAKDNVDFVALKKLC